MILEIRKTEFINKGAELMLHAALQKVRQVYPDSKCVMAPRLWRGPSFYENRAALGLWQKASLFRYGVQWGNLAVLVPKLIREMYGVVLDQEINVVLDASGFVLSDQRGKRSSQELAKSYRSWKKCD